MLVECKDLTFQYPDSNTCIFSNLSFQITGPGFHALFGPSGVGKTTLAKILAKEISIGSESLVTHDLKKILYSYNLERLPGWYAVGDHLEEVAGEDQKDLARDLIDFSGLQGCLKSRFSRLSLGQQNRINLARYLLQDFDCLVMDESLANVDEATRERIILQIKERFPTKSFLYISHNVQEVSKLCDCILVLRSLMKKPQAVSIAGQDYSVKRQLEKEKLERTMIEVVNAA